MFVLRNNIKYRAKVCTKDQSGNTGFTDCLRRFAVGQPVHWVEDEVVPKTDRFVIPHTTTDTLCFALRMFLNMTMPLYKHPAGVFFPFFLS